MIKASKSKKPPSYTPIEPAAEPQSDAGTSIKKPKEALESGDIPARQLLQMIETTTLGTGDGIPKTDE